MKKLPLDRVVPGDVLAEPVIHGDGQTLLVPGTELDVAQIELMRQRGVGLVTIEGNEDASDQPDEAAPVDPELLKKVLLEQSLWYGDARKDPLLADVFRHTVARLARERSQQSS